MLIYSSGAPTGSLAPYLNLTIEVGADATPVFGDCTGFVSAGTVYNGTLPGFATANDSYATGLSTWDPSGSRRDPHLPLPPLRPGHRGRRGQDDDVRLLVGNAHQLTRLRPAARPQAWKRTVLYGAGTVSMLMISMVSSLSLWIALPWAFLDWSPTLVTPARCSRSSPRVTS